MKNNMFCHYQCLKVTCLGEKLLNEASGKIEKIAQRGFHQDHLQGKTELRK